MDKQEIELLEKIEQYLLGDLSEIEITLLKKELADYPSLAKQAAIDGIIIEGLRKPMATKEPNDADELMAIVKKTIDRHQSKSGYLTPFTNNFIRIAAIFIFFLVSSIVIYNYLQPPEVKELVLSYLDEPYRSPAFYKSGQNEVVEWKIAYQSGDYPQAITLLEDFTKQDSSDLEARFYLGLSYLYKTDPEPAAAVDHLKLVLEGKSRYGEQSLWYLGLAYYLEGDVPSAINILEKIKDYRQSDAIKLVEKMRAE